MSKKPALKSDLPADPVGDALADVYLFLLRKAAERKREITATTDAEGAVDTLPISAEGAASEEQALSVCL